MPTRPASPDLPPSARRPSAAGGGNRNNKRKRDAHAHAAPAAPENLADHLDLQEREILAPISPTQGEAYPAYPAYHERDDADDPPDGADSRDPRDLLGRLQQLRTRLGLGAPPTYTTVRLPITRLVITDGQHPSTHRRGRAMTINLGLLGVLQPPAVVPIPGTDTFRVITGRSRVLGARLLQESQPASHRHKGNLSGQQDYSEASLPQDVGNGGPVPSHDSHAHKERHERNEEDLPLPRPTEPGEPIEIECHRYDHLSATEEALMVLSENVRRAPAWAQEVTELHDLILRQLGLTVDDVAQIFGLSVASARERVRMAQLPDLIVNSIGSGAVSQATAKRLVRLTPSERAMLLRAVEDGAALTEDLVKQTLCGQLAAGMAELPQALEGMWSPWGEATSWAEVNAQQSFESQRTRQPREAGVGVEVGEEVEAVGESHANADGLNAEDDHRQLFARLRTDLIHAQQLFLLLPGTTRACLLAQALAQELATLSPMTMPSPR